MLTINRLRIVIKTENGEYGIDKPFIKGLNFIASENNTCGKSSILVAIYYCLGFEQIIGGIGSKVLTSVFKNDIKDGDKKLSVLESSAYLEISNGEDVITIYRSAKMENRDDKLITVFYSSLDKINNINIKREDMYVHMPNSATNDRGFHAFLEKFLNIKIPDVPATDGSDRKLYLQLIFSCMFIEQKHGWSDIFSGMPVLGIKESKKRVIEFVLKLDTLENERKKNYLNYLNNRIKNDWNSLKQDILSLASRETCSISELPSSPRILNTEDIERIKIVTGVEGYSLIENYIEYLSIEYDNYINIKPNIVDNFDKFQEELNETENSIDYLETNIIELRNKLLSENESIIKLKNSLEVIQIDLRNNKDAARLQKLGSDLNYLTFQNICPVCNQAIQDSLLPNQSLMNVMSIEDNINHLDAQKKMLEYALNSHVKNKEELTNRVERLERNVFTLRKLAKSLRNDLYSIDDNISETMIYKKIELENKINNLRLLVDNVDEKKNDFLKLSDDWKEYLKEKETLPVKKFSDSDIRKIDTFRNNFINNIKLYGYKSILDLNNMSISEESYLPTKEGFDMKFDSSASDNIRAIWAFTIGLLQTSLMKDGNHPNIIIFDEPDQHSIEIIDIKKFFESIIELNNKCQVIVGITINNSDTDTVIRELKKDSYNMIYIKDRAFQKFNIN